MFHGITQAMLARMRFLEEMDAADRNDGTPHAKRLRQIPPQTGQLLCILAASAPQGAWVEVGTSAGYSALWLSLAASEKNTRLITYEKSPDKAALARETFALSGAEDRIDLVEGDALAGLAGLSNISFCFLDAERSILEPCYELALERLVPGGIIAADNVISHKHEIPEFLAKIPLDKRVDSLIVPIGSGLLVCRTPR